MLSKWFFLCIVAVSFLATMLLSSCSSDSGESERRYSVEYQRLDLDIISKGSQFKFVDPANGNTCYFVYTSLSCVPGNREVWR